MQNSITKTNIKRSNTLERTEVLISKSKGRIKKLNIKKYKLLRLPEILIPRYRIYIFKDNLFLYLLRNKLYRILDNSIKDTKVRKLIKLEILKAPKGTFSEFICLFNDTKEELYRISDIKYNNSDLRYRIKEVISNMKTQILAKPFGLKHPSVKRVLEIAEEIMNKNKILNLENLYNLAKKQLKIPKSGLISIIHFLINKKILIEGSKFSKETVLSNKLRYNIFRFIKNNGAVHYSLIRKILKDDQTGNVVSSGQLVWHLEMLLKFEYIKKIKVGNYSVFLPLEMDKEMGVIYFLIRDKINRKIVNLLIEQESIRKSEIYKLINEKREYVYYRINNLLEHNILLVKEELDNLIYINPNKEDLIIHVLKEMNIIN